MPINIGIENSNINQLIEEYNIVIKDRDRFLISAGTNNSYIKNLEKQLDDYLKNILISIQNYENSLELTIQRLIQKEDEFSVKYKNIPQNEMVLRSIQRELEVKVFIFIVVTKKKKR